MNKYKVYVVRPVIGSEKIFVEAETKQAAQMFDKYWSIEFCRDPGGWFDNSPLGMLMVGLNPEAST